MFKGTYRRNGEGDYHCTFDEVKAMLRDQTDDTMDMKLLENMQMDVLNMETVHAIVTGIGTSRGLCLGAVGRCRLSEQNWCRKTVFLISFFVCMGN